ncbi:TetR/AcrR family transcriptional regulator [Salinactinospora qingdaonensis]|uniref:TetR/AcrR family transcriptional regulator n=1 Tax=Salinactinospora qingdaonensis TaxID=702744 RepID=A0ABP7GCX6_9ACTN
MPPTKRKRNRGPAAAADNRTAILATARRLFTDRGYHVPLSVIAREAGVGQGVLYRHFSTRLDLAFAVFEDNFAELETMAAEPDDEVFERLWHRLLELTIQESAFVEMVVEARHSVTDYEGAKRLRALVEAPLRRARDADLVAPELTPDDVLLAQRMAYGAAVTASESGAVREAVERVLRPFLFSRNAGRQH